MGPADPERPAAAAADMPGGLAVSQDGFTLDLQTPVVDGGVPAELAFAITGPDGRPVTDYTVEHDKELHLVVVGRDLAAYAHVHPERDSRGIWTVTAPPLTPGSYRVFADFTPAGGGGLTLGADLVVPGDHRPVALPAPAEVATVDGFDVSFRGRLVAGSESEMTVGVTRNGEPVDDLQPYLGALGHLVAIRSGDLAYLHVHPLEETAGPGGPSVRFAVEVPTAGTYRLFFDFSHGGDVRTAATTAVTADAAIAGDVAGVPADDDDHDEHGG
ncbi:MAG: hypothetical protein H0W46_08395 [Acidimicrobiia bacterium]|nr:hypothetical protein [Acidimicrobiia bacterium]